MKRICFVSYHAYGLFNPRSGAVFGGSESQLYQLAREFEQEPRIEVNFVVKDHGQISPERYGKIKVWKRKCFNFLPAKMNWPFAFLIFFGLLKKIKADIFILRAAGVETGATALFCKLFRKKMIYMTASSIDVDGAFVRENGLVGKIYLWGLKHANSIIVQNREQRELLKKNYGLESVIIKNSFPLSEEILPAEKRKYILWVSTAQQLKQPEKFLTLARKFPKEKFLMIMPKHDLALWEKIKNEVDEIENLEFIERVPFSEINKYFKKAKVFVNTSTYEGFPNTFVQSTMNGVPIVSLKVNPDNFLNVYQCGYCADNSEEKMAEYVKKLIEDRDDWKVKSENGVRYAGENHDIRKNIQKLKEIVKSSIYEKE